MRKKNIFKSAIVGLLEEITSIICGFILPRMILTYFGSDYNGIIASVTQFIGCIALLKSGIGMATKAALYEPLYNHDILKVSGIMSATMSFLRKIALIFVIGILVFACIYPFSVKEDFSWVFTSSLVLIVSLGTFFQYYFGLGNQLLLEADQRYYIISLITIINTLFNTVISVTCMKLGMSIHGVKLCSATVYCSTPIFLNYYVNRKYGIDRKAAPDWQSISKRWDAFGMQVANFINDNTDIIVASLFLNMKEVSVYTIYYLAINGIKKAISRITTGVEAALGNLKAEKDSIKLKNNFLLFEFVLNLICSVAFPCLITLIVPFVKIYTNGINDVNYSRIEFAVVACIAELFFCLRLAYTFMVQATGSFSETKRFFYFEAAINIVSSVALVNLMGLVGIAIGTLLAMVYRTVAFAIYVYKNIINVKVSYFRKRMLTTGVTIIICCFVGMNVLSKMQVTNYYQWIGSAIIMLFLTICIVCVLHFIIYRDLFLKTVKALIGKYLNTN